MTIEQNLPAVVAQGEDMMSLSADTLNSILPVQFENSEEERSYNAILFPPRKPLKGFVTRRQHYPQMFDYLADISSVVNIVLAQARFIYKDVPILAASGLDVRAIETRLMQNLAILQADYETLPNAAIAAMALGTAGNGHSHIIKPSIRYQGGYDILFSGIPGGAYGRTSTVFSGPAASRNTLPSVESQLPDTVLNSDYQFVAFGLADTVAKWLYNTTTTPKNEADKRDITQLPIKTDLWSIAKLQTQLDDAMKKAGFKAGFGKLNVEPKMPPDLEKALGKYFNFIVVKEPNHELITVKTKRPGISNDEIPLTKALYKLQVEYGLSIAMNLPADEAAFITQTPKTGRIPLTALNTWVNIWARALLKTPRTKLNKGQSKTEGTRLNPTTAPRYILMPSATPEVNKRRKQLGLYTENSRANEDHIYVSNTGRFNYCPSSEDIIVENAKAYESLQEQALQVSFDAGAPLISSQSSYASPYFAYVDQTYRDRVKSLKNDLSRYSGTLQTYNWDYNCILTSSRSDPGRLVSISLAGSSRPDSLAISDYLSKPAAEALFTMFPGITGADSNKELKTDDLKVPRTFLKSSLMQEIGEAYRYLLFSGKMPDLQTLVKRAAKVLDIKNLETNDLAEDSPVRYELGLYTSDGRFPDLAVLNKNLELLPNFAGRPIPKDFEYNPDDPKSAAQFAVISSDLSNQFRGIVNMLESAMDDARGSARSNLMKINISSGSSVEDDPHYFDMSVHNLGELSNVYNYLGGRVFYEMLQSLLKVDKRDFAVVDLNNPLPMPAFDTIVKSVMPFAYFAAKYAPDKERIHAEGEKIREGLKRDTSITTDDIHLPGSKAGFQMFPHQVETFQTLANERPPRFGTLDISPGGGKCLVGRTIVHTSKGLMRLDEIHAQSGEKIGSTGFSKIVEAFKVPTLSGKMHNAVRAFTRKGKTHSVVLENGIEFEGLGDHKLWTQDGWKRMDKITDMDFVPVRGEHMWPKKSPRIEYDVEKAAELGIDVRTLPKYLTDDLATMAGFLIAEGYIPENRDNCGFGVNERDVMEVYVKAYTRTFGYRPKVVKYAPRNKRCQSMLGVKQSDLAKFVLRAVTGVGTSQYKQVSPVIRAGTKSQHAAFLRAYFTGDGSVTGGTGRKHKRARLGACTISKELAQHLGIMLLNFGISPNIIAKTGKAYKSRLGNAHIGKIETTRTPYWISVSQRDVLTFAEEIGFAGKRKADGIRKSAAFVKKSSKKQQTSNYDVFGYENRIPAKRQWDAMLERIDGICQEYTYDVKFGNQTRRIASSLKNLVYLVGAQKVYLLDTKKRKRDCFITRGHVDALNLLLTADNNVVRHIRRDAEVKKLRAEINEIAKHRWTRVESSRKTGRTETVYDIEVENDHSYVANGYMSHNTVIGLTDIGNLIHRGLIKRPCVLAPNGLVRNWVEDMHMVTEGRWNIIPITTLTYKTWGEERLTKMIENAPINTIFVIGLSFLRLNTYRVVIGNHTEKVSGTLEFCRKFGFDYVILDESHKAKNMRSQTHRAIKQLTVASSVKFVRIATGTLIQTKLTDVVGQAALFGAHIFRTQEEYEAENSVPAGSGRALVFAKDTPYRARKQLAKYSAVMSFKKKEWAFLLPRPIETFLSVALDDGDDEYGQAHQMMYQAVLLETLEQIKADKDVMALLSGGGEDSEGDDSDGDDDGVETMTDDQLLAALGKTAGGLPTGGAELDEASIDELESALRPYLQRLEMMLTDPLGDALAGKFFQMAKKENYVSRKVRKIIERVRLNFTEFPWQKGEKYRLKSLCDYQGIRYVLVGPKDKKLTLEDYAPEAAYVSTIPPNQDPRWKPEPHGKVIVFCRYTRSVNAIMRALPPDLKKLAVPFSGGVKDKWGNLEAFRTTPFSTEKGVQILVANEQAISEGHNLQMASRIIRVESPWSPGELDQSSSRIFRPDTTGKFRRENVYLDWVLCNNTLEVAKLGRLISRMVDKAKFDEADNKLYDPLSEMELEPISMSLDTIAATPMLSDIAEYIEAYQTLAHIQSAEFEEMRQTKPSAMFDVPQTEMPKGSAIIEHVPYLPGMKSVPDRHNYDLNKLTTFLGDADADDAAEVNEDKQKLIGMYAHTEFGNGMIVRIREAKQPDGPSKLTSVTVQLASGDLYTADPALIYLAFNITKENVGDFTPKVRWATEADKKRAAKIERQRERDRVLEEKRLKREAKAEARNAERQKKLRKSIKAEEEGKKTSKTVAGRKAKEQEIVNRSKRARQREEDEEEEIADPTTVDLYPVVYNGFLAVEATPGEDDETDMRKIGFKNFGDYAFCQIKDYISFNAVNEWLNKKFYLRSETRARLKKLADSFQSGRGRKFNIELAPVSEFKNFYNINHKISGKDKESGLPELKIYPVIINGSLFLNVDISTNPIIRRYIGKSIPGTKNVKFEEADGLWIQFFRTRNDVIAWTKSIRAKGIEITNYTEFKTQVDDLKEKLKMMQKLTK